MVIRILVPDGINKTNRVNALQTPKSPIWMIEWLSCWKRYFLILKDEWMKSNCDPFHESSLPIISGSNSDLGLFPAFFGWSQLLCNIFLPHLLKEDISDRIIFSVD